MAGILEQKMSFQPVLFPHGNNQDKFTVVVWPGHKSLLCYPGHYHKESSAQHEFFAQEAHDSSMLLQTTHITHLCQSIS